jgi:acyl-CoA synthetase
MQITPSLLSQWTLADIQNIIFSTESTLKTLVLGGEEFPKMKFVTQWQDWKSLSKKRVFNIYGITEMSCWSTLYEVMGDEKEVSLGNPIDDVLLEMVGLEGEFILKSRTRKCILNSEDPSVLMGSDVEVARSTGDLVERREGQLFYKGRLNATVKRFGVRVNLAKIERAFDACDNIWKSCCVFDKETKKVILFYICEGVLVESIVLRHVRTVLSDHEMPDCMHAVKEFPLSSHGKISKVKLLEQFEREHLGQNQNAVDTFVKELNALCGVALSAIDKPTDASMNKKPRTLFESSFLQIGGTSVRALQIVSKIQDTGQISCPELMVFLLDNTKTIKDLVNYLRECKQEDVAVGIGELKNVTHYLLSLTLDSFLSSLFIHDC